jgi:PAS domain S-box-containing protein
MVAKPINLQLGNGTSAARTPRQVRKIQGREWWLWSFAVTITLLLTLALISFSFPRFHTLADESYWFNLSQAVRALAGLVLLFDIYTIYQQVQIHRVRRELAERDELFRLISENAADMIALVDLQGRRLYNSPAYEKVLGYSPDQLSSTSAFEQIHPDDRERVKQAAEKARLSGVGQRLEYRILHRNGSWRVLESIASAVKNERGETEKLVIVNRDITERRRAEEMLAHSAFHDALTNLPNRSLFLDRLQHAFALAKRHANYQFAVLSIDVDEFKMFNDSVGHRQGDELLIEIGKRLASSLRHNDTVSRLLPSESSESSSGDDTLARVGGDEFTVLLEDIHDPSDAIRVAERLQSALGVPFALNSQDIVLSASMGIALFTASCSKAEDLLRDADIAMYRAKRRGKARYEIFDTAIHGSALHRLKLETDLRKGVERKEFRLHYQPIVSLKTGEVIGFESLVRWQTPEGLLLPGQFIQVANETGLIIPINRAGLREACHQLQAWCARFPSGPTFSMSLNVSAREFAQPDLASDIALVLQQTGLEPHVLQFEIMETVVMEDAERASEVFSQLKALGVRLSIDDFGTGYSSLSRLQQFPVDTLKIDRSFISKMDTDTETREIVRIILMLAHSLGLKVVAEGTETAAQVKQLCDLNCEFAQGYFFARPADQESIQSLLTNLQQGHGSVSFELDRPRERQATAH